MIEKSSVNISEYKFYKSFWLFHFPFNLSKIFLRRNVHFNIDRHMVASEQIVMFRARPLLQRINEERKLLPGCRYMCISVPRLTKNRVICIMALWLYSYYYFFLLLFVTLSVPYRG